MTLMAAAPFALSWGVSLSPRSDLAQDRFSGLGLVLVVNAVDGAEMLGVKFYDDRGLEIFAKSAVTRRNRDILSVGSGRVPLSVRVVWRINPKPVWGRRGGIDYEGEIIGDYMVPVASRIPDEVIKEIRSSGGALRLKFRLKPDGVLFGWDIQRKAPLGDVSIFEKPGGDFLDTRY